MELARVTRLDDGGDVLEHLRPVKTAPEDLASEGTHGRVVATFATMDVSDEHSFFLRGTHLSAIPFGRLRYKSPSRMKYDLA